MTTALKCRVGMQLIAPNFQDNQNDDCGDSEQTRDPGASAFHVPLKKVG